MTSPLLSQYQSGRSCPIVNLADDMVWTHDKDSVYFAARGQTTNRERADRFKWHLDTALINETGWR